MDTHFTKSRMILDSTDEASSSGTIDVNPTDFVNFLPWACQKLSVYCILEISKVLQVGYVSRMDLKLKGKDKPSMKKGSVQGALAFIASSSINLEYAPSVDQNIVVRITATFSGDNLTYIKIDKTKHLPRELLSLLALIAPFYPNLYGLSINSGTDKYTIHEMCKILTASNITEINLDNTCIKEGYYDTILDNSNQLKVLSLARCKLDDHIIEKIVSKLEYPLQPSRTLSVLNLSTNRLTDKGAKHIAKMLRTNRRLNYLNLASNMLTDDGVDSILNVLYKFPLTIEEILIVRKNYLKYLKRRHEEVEQNMVNLREAELEKLKKRPKKSNTPKRSVSKGEVSRSSSSMLNLENALYDKAVKMAELVCGPFDDPLGKDTFSADGLLYSNGNNTLNYLNIAYNSISQYTVKILLKILKHQKSLMRNPRGLVNVCLEGNPLPQDIPEMLEIDNLLDNILSAKERVHGGLPPRRKSNIPMKVGK